MRVLAIIKAFLDACATSSPILNRTVLYTLFSDLGRPDIVFTHFKIFAWISLWDIITVKLFLLYLRSLSPNHKEERRILAMELILSLGSYALTALPGIVLSHFDMLPWGAWRFIRVVHFAPVAYMEIRRLQLKFKYRPRKARKRKGGR